MFVDNQGAECGQSKATSRDRRDQSDMMQSVRNNNVAWKEMVEDIQPRVEKMAQDSTKLQGRAGGSTTDNDLLVAMDRYLK